MTPKIPNLLDIRKADVRFLYGAKKVLADRKWLKTEKNYPLYYMWRGLKSYKGLRYDITLILPKMLGKEFNKTVGHYHKMSCGEIYRVLKGKGIFLMQKMKDGKVKDVYYVKAGKGDFVPVPPLYGHITINPSSEELKMANWMKPDCSSDYKKVENKRGFCYYYTNSGWVKNENYSKIPRLKTKKPLKSFPKNISFLYGE